MEYLISLIKTATVSRVWLVHDHDEHNGEPIVSYWFDVALEVQDATIQTIEFTVTWDPEHFYLKEVLAGMDYTIMNYDNQTGQVSSCDPSMPMGPNGNERID